MGPSPISLGSSIKWFVVFADDCTQMTWLYLLKHKNETLSAFHNMVLTQFSTKIQILRSDNGGEYDNITSKIIFKNMVFSTIPLVLKVPNRMGLLNARTNILEIAQALLLGAHVP